MHSPVKPQKLIQCHPLAYIENMQPCPVLVCIIALVVTCFIYLFFNRFVSRLRGTAPYEKI